MQQVKIDVRGVSNKRIFTVIKDLGLKETFSGQTPVSGEIGEDFTYFMAVSEQVPAIGLGVLVDTDESVKAAGGFMIQVMPGADESTIDFIEQRLAEVPPFHYQKMEKHLNKSCIAYWEKTKEILEKCLYNLNVTVPKKNLRPL